MVKKVIKILPKLKKLVNKECASFCKSNNKENFCCMIDTTCKFFQDEKIRQCNYFELGVLPLQPELELEYHKYHDSTQNITNNQKPKSRKKCDKCGKSILATGRQKYCDDCQKEVKREQTRNSMRQKRKIG